MAAYGLGTALLQTRLTGMFSATEQDNLHRWLNQITDAQMPDSNWNYFAIIVQLGFKRAGLPFDQQAIDRRFEMMDAYYLGDGWYSDGPGRPKDYYISMAFHFMACCMPPSARRTPVAPLRCVNVPGCLPRILSLCLPPTGHRRRLVAA